MVSKWFFVLPVALILVGVAALFGWFEKSPPKQSLSSRMTVEQFTLPYSDELKKECKPQEEIPAVEDGPGTLHRIWANRPYIAVSVEADGNRKHFNMPAGWDSWIGHWPPGRLRLVAKEKDTVVKTWKVR